MKWLKISLVLLLILLTANVFLGYNIIRQYISTNYLSEEAINNAIRLFDDSGIAITAEQIPSKRPDAMIGISKKFDGAEDYYIKCAGKINGRGVSDSMTQHMINNGVRIIDNTYGEYFEFYENSFSFVYSRSADFSVYDEYRSAFDLQQENGVKNEKELLLLIQERLFGNNENYSLQIVSSAALNNMTCLKLSQQYNNLPLVGCEIECILSEDDIEFIRGALVFIDIEKTYTADLIDALNIMFEEKEAHDQSAESGNTLTVESISTVYFPVFNSNSSEIYLAPAWCIDYVGNISNVRSMINGEICAIP